MSYPCEKCGVPVKVYGCRWCPDCYKTASREFDKMVEKGTEAWKDVLDNFVDDLRGGKEE